MPPIFLESMFDYVILHKFIHRSFVLVIAVVISMNPFFSENIFLVFYLNCYNYKSLRVRKIYIKFCFFNENKKYNIQMRLCLVIKGINLVFIIIYRSSLQFILVWLNRYRFWILHFIEPKPRFMCKRFRLLSWSMDIRLIHQLMSRQLEYLD
jgi:hypothetical protein